MTLDINSGICKCGCDWQDHHLGMIVNADAWAAIEKWCKENNRTYPPYVPQECDHYGFNEYGGMRYNKETDEYEDHCHGYEDVDGPLAEIEWEYSS